MKKLIPAFFVFLFSLSVFADNVTTGNLPSGGNVQSTDTIVGTRGTTTLKFNAMPIFTAPGTNGQLIFNNHGVYGGQTSVPVANGGTGATSLGVNFSNNGNIFNFIESPKLLGNVSTYTFLASDLGQTLVHNSGSSVTDTLAQAGSVGFESGKSFTVQNQGTDIVTINTSISIFNNDTSQLTLSPNEFAYILSNGTNWIALLGKIPTSYLTFSPGTLTSISTGSVSGYSKIGINAKVDNMIVSSLSATCTTNPTVAIVDCSNDTSCASPQIVASATISTSNTAINANVVSPTIISGDYIGWEFTSGLCSSINIQATAQIHQSLSPQVSSHCSYTPPLDSVSGSVAAYSFRLLKSTYSGGNIVKIRRSSDSTTKVFTATIPNCSINTTDPFFDGSTYSVDTWYDQSGNNANVLQATTTAQPTVALNCQNGQPCAVFTALSPTTAGGQSLSGTLASGVSSDTLNVVASTAHDTASDGVVQIYLDNSNSTAFLYSITSGACAALRDVSGSVSKGTKTCSANTFFRGVATQTNTLSSIYLGGIIGTDSTTSLTIAPASSIYMGVLTAAAPSWTNGKTSEIIVFAPSLSISNSNTVSSNQGSFWGL